MRRIQYLRISLTDRCNLRCVYCMPEAGVPDISHADILRYEEIVRIARLAVKMGITHIRLTGGEPLVRSGIVNLVEALAKIPGLEDLAMTSNGTLLERYAAPLAQAGLQRINISLDTLKAERFHSITRLGNLKSVLRGRQAALAAGLKPVKINSVVVRGLNDNEVVDLARLTLQPDWHLRFIEVMPLNKDAHWSGDGVVTTKEIRSRIENSLGALTPMPHIGSGVGPARYYQLPGAQGTLGFISPISEHFCVTCNRLRLTSDGQLLPCLMSNLAFDLRRPLRNGASDADLQAILTQAIAEKPQRHHLEEDVKPDHLLPMSHIGG